MAKFAFILAALVGVNFAAAATINVTRRGTFITAPCKVDSDCNSGCCAVNSGKCAGAIIALSRDGGCGGPGQQSNSIAAEILRGNCPGTTAKRSPLSPDPNGAKNIGNGQGGQFITGQCLNNADCASGCCAKLPVDGGETIGICSGPAVGDQQGKQGCGFSGSTPATSASTTPATQNNGATASAPAGDRLTAGSMPIGAQCAKDNDCTTACCGTSSGVCTLAKQAGPGGCGRGAAPNNSALDLINGNAPVC